MVGEFIHQHTPTFNHLAHDPCLLIRLGKVSLSICRQMDVIREVSPSYRFLPIPHSGFQVSSGVLKSARSPRDASLPLLIAILLINVPILKSLFIKSARCIYLSGHCQNSLAIIAIFRWANGTHMKAARHILRYLELTRTLSVVYDKENAKCFACLSSLMQIGEVIKIIENRIQDFFNVNGPPICWTSRKQTAVVVATMDAKYRSLSDAAREAMFEFNKSKNSNPQSSRSSRHCWNPAITRVSVLRYKAEVRFETTVVSPNDVYT